MTKDEAIEFIDAHLITSLGTLPHGYVMYAETAKILINKIFNELQLKVKLCDGCKFEYWYYGEKFCQKNYECARRCLEYSDKYKELL